MRFEPDRILARYHRAILALAVVAVPLAYLAEVVGEMTDGDATRWPRWYIYLPIWITAGLLLRSRRPDSTLLNAAAVLFVAVSSAVDAWTPYSAGSPDSGTSMAVVVVVSMSLVALRRRLSGWLVASALLVVGVTAVATSTIDGLGASDVFVRVLASALLTGLGGWTLHFFFDGLRRAARSASELAEARTRLIASVSHELRTPLTGILGFAEALATSPDLPPEERQDFIRTISDQSRDMSDIVEDLLTAARADIGTLEVDARKVDLRMEAQATLEGARLGSSAGGVAIGEGSVAAVADPLRCRQIIRNLVTNANRYGGSTVRVSFGETEDMAMMEVSDDGGGIESSEIDELFQPYYRARQVSTQPGSVGLGLFVSRHLARMMGGDLTVRAEDGWTVFRLELPLADVRLRQPV